MLLIRIGQWVGPLCILTVHLMGEILGTALIKAINRYIDEEPLPLIRHQFPVPRFKIHGLSLWIPESRFFDLSSLTQASSSTVA